MVSAQTGTDSPYKRGQVGEQVKLYHTTATRVEEAGYASCPMPIRSLNMGGGGPHVENKNQSTSALTNPTDAGRAAPVLSSGNTAGRDVGNISPRDRVVKPG